MRPLVVYFLLVVMLVVTVMAIEINPTDIGPDPDEIDLSRFKSVYQLSIFRAYTTERNQLVNELRARHGHKAWSPINSKAAEEEIAQKRKELDGFLKDKIRDAEAANERSIGRYLEGKNSVAALRKRIPAQHKALQRARELEKKYRATAQRAAWAVSAGSEDKGRARERQEKFTALADFQAEKAAEISEQIRVLEELLRQIEERQRQQEEGSTTSNNDRANPGGSSGDRHDFSLAEPFTQQAGRFIGDRVGPWIGRTSRILQGQPGGQLRLDHHVPGGLRPVPQLPKMPYPY